jgi:hypothetical protein
VPVVLALEAIADARAMLRDRDYADNLRADAAFGGRPKNELSRSCGFARHIRLQNAGVMIETFCFSQPFWTAPEWLFKLAACATGMANR